MKRAHNGALWKLKVTRISWVERASALRTKDWGWHPTPSLCQGSRVLLRTHVPLFLSGMQLDYISQPSLHLGVVRWLHSGYWNVSRSDVGQFQAWPLNAATCGSLSFSIYQLNRELPRLERDMSCQREEAWGHEFCVEDCLTNIHTELLCEQEINS